VASSKCAQAAHVHGLPSGERERGGVGEDPGEVLAALRAEGVAQAGLELGDVSFDLRHDGRGSQPPVEQADGVRLALEYLDDDSVDEAGAGDLAQQLGGLVTGRSRGRCSGPVWLAGGDAEADAGVVGHGESVGDSGGQVRAMTSCLPRMIRLTRSDIRNGEQVKKLTGGPRIDRSGWTRTAPRSTHACSPVDPSTQAAFRNPDGDAGEGATSLGEEQRSKRRR
jgi:hypothetical protein